MANEILKLVRKTIKYGLRGGATIFIPFVTFPLISNLWSPLGLGAALQCGLLLKIPLVVVWFQTVVAWIDDGLRWIS